MSVIPSLAYGSTAFFISVWIPLNSVIPYYHSFVFFLLFLFKGIVLISGGSITDQDIFWWWEFLLTAAGVFTGYVLKLATNGPQLLREKMGWETSVIIRFPLTTFLYAASILIYANDRLPDSPWGLLGTALVSTLVILLVEIWTYNDNHLTAGHSAKELMGFFLLWMTTNFIYYMFIWIVYSGLDELWVSFIACGGSIAFILIIISIYVASLRSRKFAQDK